MIRLIDGIDYEIRKDTNGIKPLIGQTVSVHYMVAQSYEDLEEGPWLDSSYDREKEFEFKVGAEEVIKGIDIGIQNVRLLELHWFKLSADYAFGRRGIPKLIPPNADLYIGVYLMGVK